MSSSPFLDSLDRHPAVGRLGDVELRYEPSMLIAETARPRRTLFPTAAWIVGVAALLSSIATMVEGAPLLVPGALAAAGAVLFALSTWLERREARHRRFVANFATVSLRLDFTTTFAGLPRTVVLPFDDVASVDLLEQEDGRFCLTVDFHRGGRRYREVLAAHIGADSLDDAHRLRRLLGGAFGLAEGPADSG